MERRTALGLIALTMSGLAGCTLLGLDDPPGPKAPNSTTGGEDEPGEGAPSKPSVDDETVEPFVVKGRVSYLDGRPIEGVEIFANNTLGYNSYLTAVTDADGRYRIEIDNSFITTWRMFAQADIDYHGQIYTRELDHDGKGFASATGGIVDMLLKMSGPITQYGPTDGTNFLHGVRVHVQNAPESEGYLEIEEIEVTMVPTGPLLDGSTGETIVSRLKYAEVNDVPIGEYEISLAHHAPDGTVTPLQLRIGWDEGEVFDSVTALIPAEEDLALYYVVPAELSTD